MAQRVTSVPPPLGVILHSYPLTQVRGYFSGSAPRNPTRTEVQQHIDEGTFGHRAAFALRSDIHQHCFYPAKARDYQPRSSVVFLSIRGSKPRGISLLFVFTKPGHHGIKLPPYSAFAVIEEYGASSRGGSFMSVNKGARSCFRAERALCNRTFTAFSSIPRTAAASLVL